MKITKNFVTFLSPGTIVAETTTQEIDSWDIDKAIELSKSIKERHAVTPYGFYFTTRERGENDFDSIETKQSNMYFLGGEILTLETIKKMNNPDDRILISNMEANHWDKVIRNRNSWLWTQPLKKGDIVIITE